MKPIADKAEVAIDFPDGAYIGSFSRHSRFEVVTGSDTLTLKLENSGEGHRAAMVYLHYFLLADILSDAAEAFASSVTLDDIHREALRNAASALAQALDTSSHEEIAR